MLTYNLNETLDRLTGPTREQIVTYNQWAAVALEKFHSEPFVDLQLVIYGDKRYIKITWDSNFPKATMKERNDITNFGGVAFAWFIMSVFLDFKYVEQTEIKSGVDYFFRKEVPDDTDLNFLEDNHYVEISGILEETPSNTIERRLKVKHRQIEKGSKFDKPSSVAVTLFSKPLTIIENHR